MGVLMRVAFLVGVVAMVVAVGTVRADAPRPRLVIVMAKDSKITSISKAELRRCFSGDPVVLGSQRLVPFNLPPSSAGRVTFDRAILAMSSEEVGRFWVDRKVRGQSQAPRALPTAHHVVKIVARFSGAIAYVPIDQVTDDVRVIAIDDARPGAAGYPLN
ncbi:MAG: hypothetical protein ABI867_17580 [Kofleriaceae bacterium]